MRHTDATTDLKAPFATSRFPASPQPEDATRQRDPHKT